MIYIVFLFIIIAIIVLVSIEGFDPLENEFVKIPGRLFNMLKGIFDNVNLGYFLPAGVPMHLGPCDPGHRDIAGSCWGGKEICDVTLPVCSGGCNTTWDNCIARVGPFGGVCIGGPRVSCTPIQCTPLKVEHCPHITKFLTDRMTCSDKENVTGLCYDRCRSGYKRNPIAPYHCVPSWW